MTLEDIPELHYITPIENVASILREGILSHARVQRLPHSTVAMPEVQDKRAKRVVPGGRPLHEYANLYFNARNPMMYKRQNQRRDLCVLAVSQDVLLLEGVVISDGNAASQYTAFWPSPGGLKRLSREMVYARDWTDEDQIRQWRRARCKCAEVLVPDRVPPQYVQGAYVCCARAEISVREAGFQREIRICTDLFFGA